ncbi:Eukaryotic translation initiation factor 3 subunit J [Auxenochlorella protothecoides]|uniref:Eukaryotic translation initiation factor 3 subunit J n=1 Tax=Auxenochlorella protothecoides TaxID=3075 RepID=A0A087SQT4_AUXPR|nr:Eukaryotic translation initiation factor 3 subunit J [Auxenochlorella protothecoides]KFM28088.1 Eukaryotic translation initiation factor 3 subunit J [Auxenochlorella protothecoides]RMZ54010.1 hypothetical protein APUTEX25_002587 [Auxenochlorella protothecoides]|eukprot:RMZ54010.1 hypothetical protein APUTEX25_002587 [Auxenochlorella protothecoides]
MGDSWEDWDDEEAVPVVPVPGSTLAAADINSKFAGEDEEEEAPKWKANVPKPQAKAKKMSKYDESKGLRSAADEGPLDDPIAEKLRLQRLVEESDYQNAMELFGTVRDLDGFVPKSAKDFEEYAASIVAKYLLPHASNSNYKTLLKQLFRKALTPLTATDTKDVETSVAGVRSEKLKEEKAATAGKKATKKGSLNVGRSGGTAGLDDYVYDDVGVDEDYDFM